MKGSIGTPTLLRSPKHAGMTRITPVNRALYESLDCHARQRRDLSPRLRRKTRRLIL